MEKGMSKSRAEIALERLDEVASRCERTWGVDRLPRLVAVDLAERFYRQKGKLDDVVVAGSPADQEYEAGRMVNAWMALDAAARAAGAEPASAKYMEARMSDGRLCVVCSDLEGHHHFVRQREGRAAVVWNMEEIVRVIEGQDLVNRTKHLFDGAVVEEVRVRPEVNWKRGDELPDDMRNQFLAAG